MSWTSTWSFRKLKKSHIFHFFQKREKSRFCPHSLDKLISRTFLMVNFRHNDVKKRFKKQKTKKLIFSLLHVSPLYRVFNTGYLSPQNTRCFSSENTWYFDTQNTRYFYPLKIGYFGAINTRYKIPGKVEWHDVWVTFLVGYPTRTVTLTRSHVFMGSATYILENVDPPLLSLQTHRWRVLLRKV